MVIRKQYKKFINDSLNDFSESVFNKIDKSLTPEVRLEEKDDVQPTTDDQISFTEEVRLSETEIYSVTLLLHKATFENYAIPIPGNYSSSIEPFIKGVARMWLRQAAAVTYNLAKDSPVGSYKMGGDELLRISGGYFMLSLSLNYRTSNFEKGRMADYFFDNCNKVSQLYYEKKEISGSILITGMENKEVKRELSFKDPFPFSDTKKLRKVLELTDENLHVISDSYRVYALGMVRNTEEEPVFTITFDGKNRWKISQDDRVLMVMHDGIPNVYKDMINKESFIQSLLKAKGDLSHEQKNNIVSIAERAGKLKHGGLIVISDKAKDEAGRLGNQGLPIEPIKLQPDVIDQFTSIDGAILMDWDCNCYAIGVILDGIADKDKGDPTRGSRYNSAARYCNYRNSEGDKVIAIVVSEDGMVNVVPESTN